MQSTYNMDLFPAAPQAPSSVTNAPIKVRQPIQLDPADIQSLQISQLCFQWDLQSAADLPANVQQ